MPDPEPLAKTFVSPEDFDPTGILTGVDPCASSYWWVPEMHAEAERPADGARFVEAPLPAMPVIGTPGPRHQAAARPSPSRSSTAAA